MERGLEEYLEKVGAMINRLTEDERDRLLDQYDSELKALGLDKDPYWRMMDKESE